jgi:hypothetical protein
MADGATCLLPLEPVASNTRWFSTYGGVVRRPDGGSDVLVGGTLVGSFAAGDFIARDVVIVALGSDPHVHLGALSEAFELSSEMVRQIRRRFESGGLDAIVNRRPTGHREPLDDRQRARLRALFVQGVTIAQAREKVSTKRRPFSRATAGREHLAWVMSKEPVGVAPHVEEAQSELAWEAATTVDESPPETPARGDGPEPTDSAPRSGTHVQHLGAWILVAMVAQLGLHSSAVEAAEKRVDERRLRMAIDATLVALAIGEPTVEGVRRLATTTAPLLLRTSHAPTPSWVRRILGRLSQKTGAALLHWRMLQRYLASAKGDETRPAVFYVDNHLRPYSGQEVLRYGWRMQDKRACPGVTDYYVHDEDGRPLWREAVPDHASLTAKLKAIGMHLRLAINTKTPRVLLAFDRAGAFPESMGKLQDSGFDFVTYERRPYPLITAAEFDEVATIDGEAVSYHESLANLEKGRGQLRRIAFRTEDGRQVNLLSASSRPVSDLIAVQQNRWRQENGFKHGVERWGINQLDGRSTEPYPEDTIVPNPARRRLDRSIRLLLAREGHLRCALADATDGERRKELEAEIARLATQREEMLALRPTTPARAPLAETVLAGKLVRHDQSYKTTLDTLRIACANAEADLAAMLSVLLPKPAEAKMLLAAVFCAPGDVRVGSRSIAVRLDVAANAKERAGLDDVFRQLDALRLCLPGDSRRRWLRVRLQVA